MDEHFPKSARLLQRREFLHVQNTGRKIHLADFLVFIIERHTVGSCRLGITVSKKVGNSVRRNWIKRRLREAWRRTKFAWPEKLDVVIVAKRSAATMTWAQLLIQMQKLSQKMAASSNQSIAPVV